MAGRRTEEAIDAFLERLRRTTDCVTDQPVVSLRARNHIQHREVAFAPRGTPARLRSASGRRAVLLEIAINYIVVETGSPSASDDIQINSYGYHVTDTSDHEILAFHWHPFGVSDVTDPHLHLSSRLNPIEMGGDQDPLPLAEMHIPTGFVTLEDVVRLLIAEFGIRPRRPDWDAILRENRALAHAELAG